MVALTKAKRKNVMPTVSADSTFREASESWLRWSLSRNRKPIKPSSVPAIQCPLDKWILPHLGDLPLSKIHNGSVKVLVSEMSKANLSPKSIQNYVQIVKSVVSSVVDEETGIPLHPRKWNPALIDMPVVEDQRQPCYTRKELQDIVNGSSGWWGMLLLILASTGLRIGEALALESVHVVNGGRTIKVEQQVNRFGKLQATKTKSGVREVDIAPDVTDVLLMYTRSRKGLLFPTREGSPRLVRNLLRRISKVSDKGFHAFRRARATHLSEVNCNHDLLVFWLGHSPKGVTSSSYVKLSRDLKFRLAEAERVGLGFKLAFDPEDGQEEE